MVHIKKNLKKNEKTSYSFPLRVILKTKNIVKDLYTINQLIHHQLMHLNRRWYENQVRKCIKTYTPLCRMEYYVTLTSCACEKNLITWESVHEITLSG